MKHSRCQTTAALYTASPIDPQYLRDYDSMTVKALQQLTKDRGIGLMNLRDYKRAELIAELRANDKGHATARPTGGAKGGY